jgi:hypothetical protein
MFENYLLNPAGIAAVATSIAGFRDTPIREDEVSQLIQRKSRELRYYCSGTREIPTNWVIEVDGAAVLKEIFSELSENRVQYDKVRHSVGITQWIIDNAQQDLREISGLLVRALSD